MNDKMKGSIADLAPMLVILFMLGLSFFVTAKVLTEYKAGISNMTDVGNQSKEIVDQGLSSIYLFDGMMLFLTITFGIITILGAFMVKSHPVFFFLSFIMTAIITFISAVFTNAFTMVANSAPFSTIAQNFPITIQIFRNLPYIVLGFSVLIAIALYGKSGRIGV